MDGDVVCAGADAQSPQGTLWRFGPTDGAARKVGAVPYYAHPVGVDGDELVLLEYPVDAVGEPGAYASVLSVNTATGKSRRVALPKQGRVTQADDAVRLIGGTLYSVRADGLVTAVSRRTGTVRWSHDTGVEHLSAPVFSDTYRALYFVSAYGRLPALGSTAGHEMCAHRGAGVLRQPLGTGRGGPRLSVRT